VLVGWAERSEAHRQIFNSAVGSALSACALRATADKSRLSPPYGSCAYDAVSVLAAVFVLTR